MTLKFDLQHVKLIEFGVGRDDGNGQTFSAVPVDTSVQTALREMVQATWDALQAIKKEHGSHKYEPSEKHSSTEYLFLPLNDDMVSPLKDLHEAANLTIAANALVNPAEVFCYFARLSDNQNRRITALRRATQFKGVLKSKGRLVRMLDDSLQIVEDTLFRLDSDFDLLIDAEKVHILRPSGFEFAGKLQQAILDAVPENIEAIKQEIDFVEFGSIATYAAKHPRAARYLASIRGQQEMNNIDKAALKKLCKNTDVEVGETKGKIVISVGHEMGFLEVLDRRRYELELVKGKPERFRAPSRKPI